MVVNHKQQKGMTLIELVVVLVIIAILASVAMVQMKDVSEQTKTTVLEATATNVKSAFAIAITELQRPPTVTELTTYIQEKNVTAKNNGIEFVVSGKNYLVPTYTTTDCVGGSETTDVSQTVKCIGIAVESGG